MRSYVCWLVLLYAIAEAAEAKSRALYWKRRYERKHLMFKMATEEFNKAWSLLTTEEREQVREVFDANEEFLKVVFGDGSD